MEQLRGILASISIKQRLTIIAVVLAAGAGLLYFLRWQSERDFQPLYSALSAEDAGAILQKVKEAGVEHRLSSDGGTVLVPSARVAELRLGMAAAGLPKTGRIGFELFDQTNFGATEFVEQVNYRRALEGELERSVMSLGSVESARVHLTFSKDSIFLESRQPAKASVLVRLRAGAALSAQNVAAITYLVGSAVESLTPEAVSVVDMKGNVLSRPRRSGGDDDSEASEMLLDYRQRVEKTLVAKINSTLEPLLGAENFRASVSVDCDSSSGEQSEETFDPSRTVMLTSQKTEESGGEGSAAGVPGTASNLPRPTSRPSTSHSGMTRRTENVSYQSSRVVRKTRLPQGSIKRVSTSLLLAHAVRWQGEAGKEQRVLIPPSPEKLKAVRELVAGIVGLTPERGDQIIVEALPFEGVPDPERPLPRSAPGNSGGLTGGPLDLLQDPKMRMPLIIGAAALALLLAGAVFVVFRRKRRVATHGKVQPAIAGGSAADIQGQLDARLAEQAALQDKLDSEALLSLKLPAVTTKKTDVLLRELRENAKKDASVPAHIIQDWIRDRG